tara:strand:+ start:18 stop:254 length:237 start_codon:yes stop_codon:yes gene_type:complete
MNDVAELVKRLRSSLGCSCKEAADAIEALQDLGPTIRCGCGWVGTWGRTGTTINYWPEGIYIVCPGCGAPEDSLKEAE